MLVGIRPSIGGLYFDALFKTDHTSKLTVTEHPVETGANIADHEYMEPDEVSMEVGVTDSAIDPANYGSGARSVKAYDELRKLQANGKLLTVVTRLRIYRNMKITTITSPDDFSTMNALRAYVMMREVKVVTTETVTISPRASAAPQKTGSTNSGAKQPDASPPRQSILRQASSQLGIA